MLPSRHENHNKYVYMSVALPATLRGLPSVTNGCWHWHQERLSEVDMFIAMNRFKIALGSEDEFVGIWKNRETYLETVPGFKEFHLLQGPSTDEYTLFASHTTWESKDAFEDWTKSDAFRQAHANAGSNTNRAIYLGPPQLELFEDAL